MKRIKALSLAILLTYLTACKSTEDKSKSFYAEKSMTAELMF